MSFKGTVKNGVIVLPPGATLPNGTNVEIRARGLPKEDPFVSAVKKVKKKRTHWPKDYSRNLDRYLYGGRERS